MEILQTIALLCQIGTAYDTPTAIDEKQLRCQKYYVTCLGDAAALTTYKQLAKCIKDKK